MRIKYFYLLTIFFFCLSSFAQDNGYTVSGEIYFQAEGMISVSLVTENEFEGGHRNPPQYRIMIQPSQEELEQKKVVFEFKDIPEGVYSIKCFQDTNGNMKFDKGLFGPKEPWGFYFPDNESISGRRSNFDEICFELNQDLSGVKIELQGR
jgi:uncharacterized protein (DUF2141 family)